VLATWVSPRRRWVRLAKTWRGFGRGALVAVVGTVLSGAMVFGLTDLGGFGATPANADSAALAITMALQSTPTMQSGSTWQYQIALTCSGTVGLTCDDVTIAMPIPPDLNVSGATNPSSWSVSVAGTDPTLVPSYTDLVGGNWVIEMLRPMEAGEAIVFSVNVRTPTRTTPNNTSWTMKATASGSNVDSQSTAATATATSTAAPACAISPASNNAAGPAGSTRTFNFSAYAGPVSISTLGTLAADPAVPPGTLKVVLPAGFTFVSASWVGGPAATYDAPTRTITWSPSTTGSNGTVSVTVVLPSTPGSYIASSSIFYTAIGYSTPTTCTGSVTIPVTDATITGNIATKSATGVSRLGSSQGVSGASSGTGNYANAAREGTLPAASPVPTFNISLLRNNATYVVHAYDGIPCLTSGDGLSPTTPYESLPEGSVCTSPAFHVLTINVFSAYPLTNQVITVGYTDGSSEVIPNSPTLWTAPAWTGPADKMVAWVTIDGSYSVDDPVATKTWTIYGWPVASFPATDARYLRNTLRTSGPGLTTANTTPVYVGMQTVADGSFLYNLPVSNTYSWSSGWLGTQTMNPVLAGAQNGMSSRVGPLSTDQSMTSQQRYAVVIPGGSGINIDYVLGIVGSSTTDASSTSTTIANVTQTDDYDGLGSTLYSISGSLQSLVGIGASVRFGSMEPGVYEYYTYSGFTDSDPSDGGASCTAGRGTLITDTTGIIGPVGVPRMLCQATNTIIVTSPGAGLALTKTVSDITSGTPFAGSPTVVPAVAGDTVQFRIRIANVGTTLLTNLVLYDVLPYPNDKGVIGSQTTVDRGSTVQPVLASVTVPANWTATYTNSTNPCRSEVEVTTGCTTVAWSGVQPSVTGAIRLVSASLATATYADVILTYVVPSGSAWQLGDVAWNSVGGVATQGGLQLPPFEAPKVGFGYPSSSLAWQKTDPEGHPLAGATFRVTGPNGYDVTVTDNQAPDADPDDGGFLLNRGLVPGTYTITETDPPDNYKLADPVQVDVPPAGQRADYGPIVDEPEDTFSIALEKAVSATTAAPGDTVTYTITVTNTGTGAFTTAKPASFTDDLTHVLAHASYNNDASATGGTPSYAAPVLSWSGPLAVNASVTVTYTMTMNATVPAGGVDLPNTVVSIVPDNNCLEGSSDPDCTVSVHVEQPEVTVFVHKVGSGSVGLAGSAWQVLADDGGSPGVPVGAATITPVAGDTGMFKITGLRAGTWWLMETQAPIGHNLLAEPVRFIVAANGQITLDTGSSSNITAGAGTPGQDPWWVITVADVPQLVLPYAGGSGAVRIWLTGGALVAISLLLGAGFVVADRRRFVRA